MNPTRTGAGLLPNVKLDETSQINLLTLFESIPDAIIIHDLKGKVFAMNEPAFKLSKVKRQEVDRFNVYNIVRGYTGFNLVSDWWPDVILGNRHECEWSFIERDTNEKVSLQISMSPTIWDGMPAIATIIRDIENRKKYEENLIGARKKAEDSEFKFRTLFEQASDGIFINDKNGNYLEVNASSCKMLGYSRKELLNKNVGDIILKEDLKSEPLSFGEMRKGKVVVTERLLVRKDGSVFPAEISGSRFPDGRIQGIVRDITERKKFEADLITAKEKAEETDRLKTAFLHNMSHEIRTPLNAIMGFADLLPEYLDDPLRLRRYSEIIRQRGNDLIELIDDILVIAQIESGQLTINPEECNLSIFFDDLRGFLNGYKARLDRNDVSFNILIAPELKNLNVKIDHAKLKQILTNLVGNAFKFTSMGQVEVVCQQSEPDLLLFSVSDTGIGIAREMHAKIFNRFMQLNQNAPQIFGGTGLGLSIVHGLINIFGGKIWLDSEVGKGSTFYFTIPFQPAPGSGENQMEQISESKDELVNLNILIVEDDYYNAEYLKEVLSDTGFAINHASSGRKAIETCLSQSVDLVIMDVWLPDMTGFEAITHIRKIKPDQRIIAQTAYVLEGEEEKAHEAGCIGYVIKPIKRDLLLSILSYKQKS